MCSDLEVRAFIHFTDDERSWTTRLPCFTTVCQHLKACRPYEDNMGCAYHKYGLQFNSINPSRGPVAPTRIRIGSCATGDRVLAVVNVSSAWRALETQITAQHRPMSHPDYD